MARYSTATILKNQNLNRYYSTIIIETPTATTNDIYIKTTTPDRLDRLAYIFYEDQSLWWVIAAANGLGKGTYVVPSNKTLRIPSNPNIQQFITNINNER